MNLEQTFRSAVGTMRWRIKFVVVALAVIFGARLYVRSQAILFSAPDIALWSVESGALLSGASSWRWPTHEPDWPRSTCIRRWPSCGRR